MLIYLYVYELGGLIAEVHRSRAGAGFRRYMQVTPSSWRRIMYLVDKYKSHMDPYCIRLSNEVKSPDKPWCVFISIEEDENER